MNYEDEYSKLLLEVMSLRRELRKQRLKNVLASLAAKPNKSYRLEELEKKLHDELHGHNRGERIDLLLELLETYL